MFLFKIQKIDKTTLSKCNTVLYNKKKKEKKVSILLFKKAMDKNKMNINKEEKITINDKLQFYNR